MILFSMLTVRRFFNNFRLISSTSFTDFDFEHYCCNKKVAEIKHNVAIRKGKGDIDRVLEIYNILKATSTEDKTYKDLVNDFNMALSSLPNKTHSSVINKTDPEIIHELNEKKAFNYTPLEFSEITRVLNLMRTNKLGHTSGHKSYYLLGELAELEEALIKYTVSSLLKKNFKLVSVPDILPSNVLESCGMAINKDRTQIYSLDPVHHGPDLYLSGTAEMSLAGLVANTVYVNNELPIQFVAVSRCYRAETSNIIEERGIYRVHQFNKVEMFVLTKPEQSDNMLESLRKTQEELFFPLGFHMKVLDMPPHELGASAYRKYDIEAWMPGRGTYGEISSCSNCTDYQSRRLNIKYFDGFSEKYVHSLNGTACAIPRMLIALVENHQDPKGKILIPDVLQPFMNGKKYIGKNTMVPELKILKLKR